MLNFKRIYLSLILFLSNIFFFVLFLLGFFQQNNLQNHLPILFFLVFLLFLFVNFLVLFLFFKIREQERGSLRIKQEMAKQADKYQKIIKEIKILAEAGKLSLGFFHDIANIVCASSLIIDQLVNNHKKREDNEEMLLRAQKINKKLSFLLKNFKQYHRSEEKKVKFYVLKEVKNIISIFKFCLIKKNIEIIFSDKRDFYLIGDRIKFYQIISNLLNNSIEAFDRLSKKNKKIIIHLERRDNFLLLKIEDNAQGIKKEDQIHVFKSFFSSKVEGGNCGLGLFLVKNFLEKDFSAKISLESTWGKGTAFKIIFPLD